MNLPRKVSVLGSTGSIGTTALTVLDRHRDRFRVIALTAHGNADVLARQVEQWRPYYVGLVQNGEAPRRIAVSSPLHKCAYNSGPATLHTKRGAYSRVLTAVLVTSHPALPLS